MCCQHVQGMPRGDGYIVRLVKAAVRSAAEVISSRQYQRR